MASPWADRRGLFQRGKEVHEPGRRLSNSNGNSGVVEAVRRASVSSVNSLEKTVSNTSNGPSSPTNSSMNQQRRRSSAASQGLFSNLSSMKRGGENYDERRASHTEMSGGDKGIMSGWWNSTFKGMQRPSPSSSSPLESAGLGAQNQNDKRRGVME